MTVRDPQPIEARRTRPAIARTIPFAAQFPASGVSVPNLAKPARAIGRWFRRYGAIVLFLVIWQLASQFELVDPSVIPPVTAVVAAIVDGFVGGKLLGNMLVSLSRSGIAFGIAVAAAVPLGLFMGSFRRFEESVELAACNSSVRPRPWRSIRSLFCCSASARCPR